jgi:hypothetical protein
MIDFHTVIPTAFLYKFSGCLFDAAIAAMIADARGRRAGLLYAFAPVSILVFSIHGQWDSICLAPFIAGMLLLRREGPLPAVGAGALYVLSVIVKPITVPFVVFFVERKRVLPLLIGAAATAALYALILWRIGDPLTPRLIAYVLDYIREGVAHLGLPVGLGVRPNRYVTLAPLLLLVPLYWKGGSPAKPPSPSATPGSSARPAWPPSTSPGSCRSCSCAATNASPPHTAR